MRSGEDPVGKGIIYKRVPEPREIYLHFERIMIEKHLAARLDELYPSSRANRPGATPWCGINEQPGLRDPFRGGEGGALGWS